MKAHVLLWVLICALPSAASAQGTKQDYERAERLPQLVEGKVRNVRIEFRFSSDSRKLDFREMDENGTPRFVSVDCATGERTIAPAPAEPEASSQPASQRRRRTERQRDPDRSPISPDGKWEIRFRNFNVVLHERESNKETILSVDGVESNAYTNPIAWSPDSARVVVTQRKAGDSRKVTLIEACPEDQLQPRIKQIDYLKPGDQVDIARPRLFEIATRKGIGIDESLAPNPWSIDGIRWHTDAKRFSYVYNQRGHQVLRVIEVDAANGTSRAVVEEISESFIDYSSKFFARYLDSTDEIIWMSERDGWNHLYLFDRGSGNVKHQITQGQWVVRDVFRVDEDNRQIWFMAGGARGDQDPYHLHLCRVNFDGGGMTMLTEGDGMHSVEFSPDRAVFVDTYSRVDQPPVYELRRSSDGSLICELTRADASALAETSLQYPQRFVAKARDGRTDIHGIIIRPTNFDPSRKYPVIEQIYAGPQGAFVPKSFSSLHRGQQQLAELGFIIVQIDGMGTNFRSRAFHDICYKNLKDSGFPDRIAWLKAAAAKHPEMDLTRVGIYGGSAGGQSAMRALLDYPDFYKAAVADSGCHDNRMDKIWWNEQWLGYPVDESYLAGSNTLDARKLEGKLMLMVGMMDANVDPSSTLQVAQALIDAGKDFDLVAFPRSGHGAGGSPYGQRRQQDFFVRHLLGVEPREH